MYLWKHLNKDRINITVMEIEQIKENSVWWLQSLQKLINAPTVAAARMRFFRGDEDAIKAMAKIQDNRTELIKNYREKNN